MMIKSSRHTLQQTSIGGTINRSILEVNKAQCLEGVGCEIGRVWGAVPMPCLMQMPTNRLLRGCVSSFNIDVYDSTHDWMATGKQLEAFHVYRNTESGERPSVTPNLVPTYICSQYEKYSVILNYVISESVRLYLGS